MGEMSKEMQHIKSVGICKASGQVALDLPIGKLASRPSFIFAFIASMGLFLNTLSFAQTAPNTAKSNADLLKKANEFVLKGSDNNSFEDSKVIVDMDFDDIDNFQYYQSALLIWQKALATDTNNANLNYKVALCYFFSFDNQLKAIPYLKKAMKSLSEDYDFRNNNEKNAPFKTLYFLAETYLENNMPDSAISYFTLYQDQNDKHSLSFNTDKGLSNSINVKFADKKPAPYKITNLGENINSKFAETNPVVDEANTTIFFASRRPGSSSTMNPKLRHTSYLNNSDIYFSTKDSAGKWKEPQAFAFNTPYDEAPVFLTKDGLNLYIRRTIKNNCDLYVSRFIGGQWQKPEPLNGINTEYNETGMALTEDAKTIYFASDRNSSGRSDIYKAVINSKGTWSKPLRLRSNINSSYNEVSPFVSADGKNLFFATNGSSHKGFGGYDIYSSEAISENVWSNPKNLGLPINTTRADINYYAVGNVKYITRMTDEQSFDIFMVEDAPIVQPTAVATAIAAARDSAGNIKMGHDSLSNNATANSQPGAAQQAATGKNGFKNKVDTEIVSITQLPKPMIQVAAPTTATPPNTLRDFAKDNNNAKQSNGNVATNNASNGSTKSDNVAVNYDGLNTSGGVRFKVLYFDNNKYSINGDATKELDQLVEYLNAHPEQKVEIDGHADGVGKWEDNWQLAIYRSRQVYNYLLEHHIAYNRMIYTSKGSAIPAASNDSEDNRKKNRRVEIYLLK